MDTNTSNYFSNINPEKINQWLNHFKNCNENEWRMHREFRNRNINMFKCGLKLFRNTCFINTAIQCLNGCLPFVEFLFLLLEKFNSLIFLDDFDFLREYMRYLCGYNKFYPLHNTDEDFKYFVKESFFNTFRQFKYGDQQDINEFIIYLLNYLEEVCKMIDITVANPLKMNNGFLDAEQFRLKCLFVNSQDFRIKCSRCFHVSNSIQEESMLSVQINKSDSYSYSLNTALDDYFGVEQITDPNEYFNCRNCKRKSPFQRSIYLVDTPFILIIQLKRFGFDNKTGQQYKIKDKISLPNELNLNKYLSEEVKQSEPEENYIYDPDDYIYDLKSIAAHYGNEINSGHYKAKVKNIFDGKWRMFDDENVNVLQNPEEEVGEENETHKIYKRTPYLLFYVQRKQSNKILYSNRGNTNKEDYYDLLGCYNNKVNENIKEIISKLPRDTTMNSLMDDDDSTPNEKMDYSELIAYTEIIFHSCESSSTSSSTDAAVKPKTRKKKAQGDRKKREKDKIAKREARHNDPIKKAKWAAREKERIALLKEKYPVLIKAKEAIYKMKYRKNLSQAQQIIIREKDNIAKALYNSDPDNRLQKQLNDNAAKAKYNAKPENRLKKQENGSKFIATKRANNPVFRSKERDYDRIAHTLRRLNKEALEKERAAERARRQVCNKTRETLIEDYENGVQEGPTNICVCCGGLFFTRSTQIFNQKAYTKLGADNIQLIYHVKLKSTDNNYRICRTCHKYAMNGKPNKIALSMGLGFPKVPQVIRDLNDLEERLCSPRLPFITIRPLEWDGQQRIKGSCVNVPTNLSCFTNILPRKFEESETIQLKLMRKMNYNNPYMYDTVSPAKCLRAIEYLKNTELFKEANIRCDPNFDWATRVNADGNVEFIISREDLDGRNKELNNNNNNRVTDEATEDCENLLDDILNAEHEDNFIANNKDLLNEPTMLINTTDLIHKRDVAIAPAEGCFPLSIVYDKYAEELAFLKIYAGEMRDRPELDLGLIYKSEFRRYDRRCAKNLTKLFFSYKKLMAKRLIAAISISLNKTKFVDKLTKKDVLDKNRINKMLKSEDADLVFRAVRSTPHFWKWKLMELNAMIRQLGCPTFFITFSPSEVNWYELIAILYRINEDKEMTLRQCAALERELRLEQIRSDPVTCSRYFANRMCLMMAYLQATNGPFKDNPVKDYFWRVDFQYRGSPHIHMMVWLQDAPQYETREQIKTNLIMDKLIEAQTKHKTEHRAPSEFDEQALVEELERSPDIESLVDYAFEKNCNACVDFIDKYITAKRTKEHMITDRVKVTKQQPINDPVTNCPNESQSSLPNMSFTPGNENNIPETTLQQKTKPNNKNKLKIDEEKMVTLKFQEHGHLPNCHIRKTIDGTEELLCKYNFPFPILEKTIILDPLDPNDERFAGAERNNLLIRKKLETLKMNLEAPYDEKQYKFLKLNQLLKELNLTFDEYILALRSSINKTTVFLKRNSAEVFLNNYNKDIMIRHRANMDIQFITDPYGCATYVSAYLLKSNAVMSGLMQKVSDETRYGEMTHRVRLNKLAGCFHSAQEVGAPEASWGILGMPVVYASRSSIYINTFRNEDRHLILKQSKVLERLHNDSEDIFQAGLLEHYAERPDNMENTCLADFATSYEYLSVFQCRRLFGNTSDEIGDENFEEDEDQYNILHRNDANERAENDLINLIADELRADELIDGRVDVELNKAIADIHQLIIQQPLENSSSESSGTETSLKSVSKEKKNNERRDEETMNEGADANETSSRKKTTKVPEHYIKLKNNQGYIRPRERPKFFRYKKFNKKNEKWDFYRAELMLYLPWRNDLAEFESLPKPDGTFDKYEESIETLLFNKANHQKVYSQHFDTVWEEMENEIEGIYEAMNHDYIENLIKAQEILMGGGKKIGPQLDTIQEENEEQKGEEELEKEYGYHADFMPQNMYFEMSSDKQDKDMSINVPAKLEEDQYYDLMSRLNKGQHMFVMNFMKEMRKKPEKKQILNFVGGGAGKGKSFLISAIYQTYIRYRSKIDLENNKIQDKEEVRKVVQNDKIYAVVCAPTGKAAFNVTGVTCHSLLSIKAKEKQFGDLTCPKAIKRLYNIFKERPLVIIDELNMVGANMFFKMHKRLTQIMNEKELDFGGLDLIGFGDLFQAEPVLDTWIFNTNSITCKGTAKDANPYEEIVGNPLWAKFKFFELTEIMRQRDDLEFAKCLHNLGELGPCALTDDQVRMLDSRIVKGGINDKQIPTEALHLFFTNMDVNDFNKSTIFNENNKQKIYNNEAVDVCRGKQANSAAAINFLATINQHKLKQGENLTHSIAFKIGIKYMLILNDDIKDGLYNGAIGILKHIILSSTTSNDKGYSSVRPKIMESEPLVKRVYLQFFESPKIGNRNRVNKRGLFNADRIDPYEFGKECPLTVIEYDERKLEFEKGYGISVKTGFEIFRKQFPLVESEAITINKAEGQTYTKIGVCLKYNSASGVPIDLNSNKLYVALSRVTKLSGLYMYGRESILTDTVRKMTPQQKVKQVKKKEQSKVNQAMKRLRSVECRLINHFEFLEEYAQSDYAENSQNKLRIMFTNIRYFTNNKRMAIESDHGFMKCDMILLCETHSYIRIDNQMTGEYSMPSTHELKNYETVFKTGTLIDTKSSHGQMCFVKKDIITEKITKSIQAPTENLTNALLLNARTGVIEDRQRLNEMWEYNVYNYQIDSEELKIMCLYKHPKMNQSNFLLEFKFFLREHLKLNTSMAQEVVIVGDFNIDFNTRKKILQSLNDEFGLYPLFENKPTLEYVNNTHGFSQPDWCFTNLSPNRWNIKGLVYEAWITDHFPIVLEIEKVN